MGSVFHEMTEDELIAQRDQALSELRELRFTFAVSRTLQSPSRVGQVKKNVARINTVLRERAIGIATQKPKTDRKKK